MYHLYRKKRKGGSLTLLAVTAVIVLGLGFSGIANQEPPEDPVFTSSDDYLVFSVPSTQPLEYAIPSQNPTATPPEAPGQTVSISPTNTGEMLYPGVYFSRDGDVTVIRVDLSSNVRFFVNPAQAPQTVCDFVDQYGLQLAVNGGGFDIGNTGQAVGYAMNEGNIYSLYQTPGVTIFVLDNNTLVFAEDGQTPPGARYAVSGFNRVVRYGELLSRFEPQSADYKDGYGTVRQRTSIGLSGNWLNIVIFGASTVTDVGRYHLNTFPGTTDVYNMDGGGSTSACTDSGALFYSERPVANIFGIFAP